MSARGLMIMNALAAMMGKPRPQPDAPPEPPAAPDLDDPYAQAGQTLSDSANTEAGKKFMQNNPFAPKKK